MSTHLSYSQIALYLDCSKRWQAKYRKNLSGTFGEALIFGSTVHAVIEQRIRDKSRDMLDLWPIAWANALKSPEAAKTIWKETPEVCAETGARIFGTYEVQETIDQIKPMVIDNKLAIEYKFEWKLGDGVPDVIGFIDCLGDDVIPWDFKTASQMWPQDKAAKEIQPLIYLAALNQLGMTQHNLVFRHLVITKAKNPRIEIFETQRDPAELLFVEDVVRGVWQDIAEARFKPNPLAMYCNAECPVYTECAGKRS